MCALIAVHENLGMYENKVVFVKKKVRSISVAGDNCQVTRFTTNASFCALNA